MVTFIRKSILQVLTTEMRVSDITGMYLCFNVVSYSFFAQFHHLRGEPQSQAQCAHIVAHTLLDTASIVRP